MPLTKEEAFGAFIDVDGTRTELDGEACAYLRAQLRVYEDGKARLDGHDPLLTTGQAAAELGVSRRTLTRMLDRGDLPCERYGNGHRRLRMSDVLRYKAAERERRHEAIEEMRRISYETGMDDLDVIEGYLKQFTEDA